MRKFIDLTGNIYSNLTVIERYPTNSTKSIWRCSCICGNECIVDGYNLKISHTQSCGCLQRERASIANKTNLVGKTFGKLTVVKEIKERQNRKIIWECLCECGIIKNIAGNHLLAGKILSCGCHRKKIISTKIRY